jgi:hypothetical protein
MRLVRWTSVALRSVSPQVAMSGLDGVSNDSQLNAAAHERPF